MQNLELKHLNQASISQTELTIDALSRIAPSCITEVKDSKTGSIKHAVDFHVLRQLLGDSAVEDKAEAYEFTWVGKQEARREAAKSITKTLRPVPEDSVDWDNTQNIYIEGDNLEALKLLQKSYLGKVKMIYIDPPYNTGNDFVYHDDFKQSQSEYDEAAGNVDEEGNRLVSRGKGNSLDDAFKKNTDSNGRFHSDWCSMIYSRLMIARSLLTEDGVIFISINDKEFDNLSKICEEVFNRKNELGCFCWRTDGNFDNQARIKTCHEYILLYAKNEELLGLPTAIDPNIPQSSKIFKEEIRNTIIKNGIKNPVCDVIIPKGFPSDIKSYTINKDDVIWPKYSNSIVIENHKTTNEVTASTGWASKAQLEEFINSGFKSVIDTKGQVTTFVLTKNGAIECIKKRGDVSHVISVLNNLGGTQKATTDMGELGNYFDYPKPVSLMKYLTKMYSEKTSLILDFFSGSATTAHAVMQLNAEDGGNRRFIMVQLPEETAEDSEAYKAGYENICEIGKERIRRAGAKIKEELEKKQAENTNKEKGLFDGNGNGNGDGESKGAKLDTGFRVFRIDSGNMKDVEQSPSDVEQTELDWFIDNVKDDRTELDLLFGCMLNWGVQLSLPMSMETVDGCNIYTVNDGDLVACLTKDKPVTENIVRAIAEKSPLRVLFRDGSFASDAAKINIFEQFKQLMDWSDDEIIKNVRVL